MKNHSLKVLLLQPPIEDFYDTDVRLQPIGLAYVKAAAAKWVPDVEVKIVDLHRGWGRHTVSIPRELAYLKNYYPYPDRSPFCAFHHYYHFGAAWPEVEALLSVEQPDMVGISSLFSPYYREVLQLASIVKKTTQAAVLLGGSHVSAMPELMLQHPAVDFVIRGEGERPFCDFLKAFQEGKGGWDRVPNLGFKKNGVMHLNPLAENFPISDLPIPDLSDFPLGRYDYEARPLCFVVTSRSCPHRCSFCSVHQTFGLQYRRRGVQEVLNEIRDRYEQGYRVFDFEDDNLTFYLDEMKALCGELIRQFPRGELQLLAMNGISYLSLDQELIGLMRDAGFTQLNLALVTSDTTVRETTKRPHTLEKYLQVVDWAVTAGLKVVSYQILGLPQESLDSMVTTLACNVRLPVLLGASPFYLTPNSPMAKQLGKVAKEADVFLSRLTAFAQEFPGFQRDDLYTLFMTTRMINFLKGLHFDSEEIEFDDLSSEIFFSGERDCLGLKILSRLFSEGILFASTSQGLKPLSRFRAELFFKVLEAAEWLQTLKGKKIIFNKKEKICA